MKRLQDWISLWDQSNSYDVEKANVLGIDRANQNQIATQREQEPEIETQPLSI